MRLIAESRLSSQEDEQTPLMLVKEFRHGMGRPVSGRIFIHSTKGRELETPTPATPKSRRSTALVRGFEIVFERLV